MFHNMNIIIYVYVYNDHRFIGLRMRPDNEDLTEIRSYHRKINDLGLRVDELRTERDRLLESKQRIQLEYARQRCDDADDSDSTDDDASD